MYNCPLSYILFNCFATLLVWFTVSWVKYWGLYYITYNYIRIFCSWNIENIYNHLQRNWLSVICVTHYSVVKHIGLFFGLCEVRFERLFTLLILIICCDTSINWDVYFLPLVYQVCLKFHLILHPVTSPVFCRTNPYILDIIGLKSGMSANICNFLLLLELIHNTRTHCRSKIR